MPTIHLMIGIPGSGKTTFVNKNIIKAHVVSTDLVRQDNIGIDEKEVWPMVYKKIGLYLKNNEDVIFDATSVSKKVRDRLKENVKKFCVDFDIVSYYFPLHYSLCMKRVELRNKEENSLYLPIDVVQNYGFCVSPPVYDEGFKECKVVFSEPKLLNGLVSDSYQGYAFYFEYLKKDNPLIIEEYSGFSNIEEQIPTRKESTYRLASVSKQFIAYAILTLVEKGKLLLSDSLYDFFDNMPAYTKSITIDNLLNHTSGLIDYETMEHTEKQISDYDVLDFIRNTKNSYFNPGSKYQYSNTAYVILGLIIEKVSNTKLKDYLLDNVFKKASMLNTKAYDMNDFKIDNRAYGTIEKDKVLSTLDQYWCSATIGDGGIYSNTSDLLNWITFLQTKTKDYPYSLMIKPNIIDGVNTCYGYGLRIKDFNNHEYIYHCGETIGTNTIIGYIKDLNIRFIFLTNKNGIDTEIFNTNLRNYLK